MDEILVHITAPTTRKDDELYRSLAEQYHAFESAAGHGKDSGKAQSAHVPSSSRRSVKRTQPALDESVISKESYGSFPSDVLPEVPSSPPESSEDGDMLDLPEDTPVSSNRLVQLERLQRSWRSKQLLKANGAAPYKSSPYGSTPSRKPMMPPDVGLLEDTQAAHQAINSQIVDEYSATEEDTTEDDYPDGFGPKSAAQLSSSSGSPLAARDDSLEADFEDGLGRAPQSTQAPKSPLKASVDILNQLVDGDDEADDSAQAPQSTQGLKSPVHASADILNQFLDRGHEEDDLAQAPQSTQALHSPGRASSDILDRIFDEEFTPFQSTSIPKSPGSEYEGLHADGDPPETSSPTHPFTQSAPEPAVDHDSVSSPDSAEEAGPLDFRQLRSEIYGPRPKTSNHVPPDSKLPSQMTPFLHQLKQQHPDLYQPSQIYGTWDYDDRGDWLIDSSSWPTELRLECWNSLSEHVRSGTLGHTALLYKDPRDAPLDCFQLHCWGEMVEEVWLLIWVCSQGRVAGSGAKWRILPKEILVEVP